MTFKEYALQDGNTLEATQTMLESRVVTEFPLNDQEILLRHLHRTAAPATSPTTSAAAGHARAHLRRLVKDGSMPTLPPEFADLEPFADWCLATEGERYGKRLASSMDEHAGVLRRRLPAARGRIAYLNEFDLRRPPRGRHPACCGSATR